MELIYITKNNRTRPYRKYKCINCGEIKLTRKETFKENLCCRPCINILSKGNKAHGWKGGKYVSHSYFNALRLAAKARNLNFELDITFLDELLEKQNFSCYYTNIPITVTTNKEKNNGDASVDRINSNFGYIKTNVVWCHKDINRMKSNLSKERFIELCNLVAKKEGTHWG